VSNRSRLIAVLVIGALAAGAESAEAQNRRPTCNGVVNSPGCSSHQRIPVFSADGKTRLKFGFVDDFLLTRPGRYALERYRLVGARPRTRYHVQLIARLNTPFCEGQSITQPSISFTTNARGNGGGFIVAPGPTPGNPLGPPPGFALQNATNSFVWQFLRGDTVAYQSNCIPVFENPPTRRRHGQIFTWPPESLIIRILNN
jgi:hypothetical protein